MTNNTCMTCGNKLENYFHFCPNCGGDLRKTFICSACRTENERNSKFCIECGNSLSGFEKVTLTSSSDHPSKIDPLLGSGITIEFGSSSSQTYELALKCAKQFSTFREYGQGKNTIYRVTFSYCDLEKSLELVEYLKGWRRRILYVDGEKVTWESVFSFSWCYGKRKGCFKPDLYCFGYESDFEFNFWGCLKANMPFIDYAEWFCFGNWLNDKGDWQFDKDRIRHELQKTYIAIVFALPCRQS